MNLRVQKLPDIIQLDVIQCNFRLSVDIFVQLDLICVDIDYINEIDKPILQVRDWNPVSGKWCI